MDYTSFLEAILYEVSNDAPIKSTRFSCAAQARRHSCCQRNVRLRAARVHVAAPASCCPRRRWPSNVNAPVGQAPPTASPSLTLPSDSDGEWGSPAPVASGQTTSSHTASTTIIGQFRAVARMLRQFKRHPERTIFSGRGHQSINFIPRSWEAGHPTRGKP
jgi:hypothetical protein